MLPTPQKNSSPPQLNLQRPQRTDTSKTIVAKITDDDCNTHSPSSATSTPSTVENDCGDTIVLESPRSGFSNPFSEGGRQGWLAVLGSMLIHCFVFAPTEFVFGIFEHHYQLVFPDSTPSSIAFVGTTGSAITYIAGFLSGIVADRFGFRGTAFVGTVIMTASLVLASFSTKLWHLYASQGVLFGIGASLTYYPAIAAPSQYFVANRGLAIGIAVSGTGLGGFVLAPLTQALIDKVDTFWTLRALALMTFVVCGGASFMIPERQDSDIDQCPPPFETQHQDCGSNKSLVSSSEDISGSVMQGTNGLNSNSEIEAVSQVNPDRGDPNSLEAGTPGRLSNSNSDATVENVENGGSIDKSREQAAAKRPSFFQSIRIFKDPQFLSLTLAELAASIGYLIPLYYMQTYAIFIGLTPEKGALILGISNGAAFVGRIVLGLIADRVSNTRTLMFCVWMTAFSVTVLWSIAKSFGTLLLMGITFNMFAGAYVSLVPVAVAESFGTKEIASMIGLMYAAGGIAIWVGSPLAGFILDSTLPNLSYTPVIITAGISMISGAIFVTSWAYFHRRAERIEEVATRVNTSCSP